MILSSSSEFEAHKIENEVVVTSRRSAFLDDFFSAISPLTGIAERVLRRFLLRLPPETAQHLTLKLLPIAAMTRYRSHTNDERLRQRVFGINFGNPVGLAAGMNKDAYRVPTWLNSGFGFVEVGTVTLLAQPGNPRPRVFRFPEDRAIINRFGLPSYGADVVFRRVAATRAHQPGIVGVNIGANRDSKNRVSDYVALIEKFAPVADYVTVNISSPNTPGLRNLQSEAALDDLLGRVIDARDQVQPTSGPTPVLLKISPDVTLSELDDIVGVTRRRKADGMIVSNTTVSRPLKLLTPENSGGLSGRPLFNLSTRILAETYVRVEGAFPLIGVGGIDSGGAALAKVRAGASLVQLCSGLVFRGLDLIDETKSALVDGVVQEDVANIGDLIGLDAAALTAEPWPVTR